MLQASINSFILQSSSCRTFFDTTADGFLRNKSTPESAKLFNSKTLFPENSSDSSRPKVFEWAAHHFVIGESMLIIGMHFLT